MAKAQSLDTEFEKETDLDSEFNQEADLSSPQTVEDTTPSQLEAALRGGAQGATFGFAEELGAGALQPVGAGKQLLNLLGANIKDEDVEAYKRELEASRAAFKAAQEAHPVTYGASEIAGGIAPAFLTGGAGATAALGKGALTQAAKQGAIAGAKMGALGGAGYSEAETGKDLAKDVAMGAGLGGALGGVITPATAKLAEMTSGAGKQLGKFGARIAAKYSPEEMDYILKNAPKIREAKNLQGMAKELAENVGNLDTFIDDATRVAESKLTPNTTFQKEDLLNLLETKYNNLDFTNKDAAKKLQDIASYIDNLGDDITEIDLNKVRKLVDKVSKWEQGSEVSTEGTKVLREVRDELANKIKQNNPEYASAIKEVEELLPVKDKAQDFFRLSQETPMETTEAGKLLRTDQGKLVREMLPTDTTPSKLGKAFTEDKFEGKQILDVLGKKFGESPEQSIAERAKQSYFKTLSEGDNPSLGIRVAGAIPGASVYEKFGAVPIRKMILNMDKYTSKVSNIPEKTIQAMKNSQSKSTKAAGDLLELLGSKLPNDKKAAALFSASQQPGVRNMLKDIIGVNSDEE